MHFYIPRVLVAWAACALLVRVASAQQPVWIAQFDDVASALDWPPMVAATDVAGNIHIAARSGRRWLITKLAADGRVLWARTHGFGWTIGYCSEIAVDDDGGVIVAGRVINFEANNDQVAYLVKFDRDGALLWTQSYREPGARTTSVGGMTLDPAGTIVLAGSSGYTGGASSAYVLKLHSDGSQAWLRTIQRDGDNYATAVALGGDGAIVVTGAAEDESGVQDAWTAKLSPGGEIQWQAQFDAIDHSPSHWDRGKWIAIDASGNSYVYGETGDEPNNGRAILLKYSPDGQELWFSQRVPSAGPGEVRTGGLALDSFGDIVTTARYQFPGTAYTRIWTEKHTPQGAVVFSRLDVPGSSAAWGLRIGTDDSIYIAASEAGDQVLLKLVANGQPAWSRRVEWVQCAALALDAQDNACVVGESGYDVHITRYTPAGAESWRVPVDGPGSSADSPAAIIADADGSLYVAGVSGRDDGPSAALLKFSSAGDFAWVRRFGDEPGGAYALALTPHGVVVGGMLGYPLDPYSSSEMVVATYNREGTLQWEAYPGFENSEDGVLAGLATDLSGDIHVTGSVRADRRMQLATAKISPEGVVRWTSLFNGSGSGAYGQAIVADSAGCSYVAATGGVGTATQFLVVKYQADGSIAWVSNPGGERPGSGTTIALAPTGEVVVGGAVRTGYWSTLIAMLAPTGDVVWSREIAAPEGDARVSHLRIGADGAIYALGRHAGSASRLATAKLSPTGELLWSRVYPATNGYAGGLDVDTSGNVYVCGVLYSEGKTPIWLRYDQNGELRWAARAQTDPSGAVAILALNHEQRVHTAFDLRPDFADGQRDIVLTSYTTAPTPCPNDGCDSGDTNGDCLVDLADLETLLSNFGAKDAASLAPSNGDVDFDGQVGLRDLALLLSRFGRDCR